MRVQPYIIANNYSPLDDERLSRRVSLPHVPGVTVCTDRRETAPTLPMINIHKQPRILSGAAREAAIEKRFDAIARKIASLGVQGSVML